MSPLKKEKLNKIRKELDKLDDYLIKIIKKRTNLVKKVLALKDRKKQIVDQKRINLILRNIKKKSINLCVRTRVLGFGKVTHDVARQNNLAHTHTHTRTRTHTHTHAHTLKTCKDLV